GVRHSLKHMRQHGGRHETDDGIPVPAEASAQTRRIATRVRQLGNVCKTFPAGIRRRRRRDRDCSIRGKQFNQQRRELAASPEYCNSLHRHQRTSRSTAPAGALLANSTSAVENTINASPSHSRAEKRTSAESATSIACPAYRYTE